MRVHSSSWCDACPVSVGIPTWRRTQRLLTTLDKIRACQPGPGEILIHVDAGDQETAPLVRKRLPSVRVLESSRRMGPGGGRNKLIAAAKYPIVASFDDDSYPLDTDYFERLSVLFDRYPDASVIASEIIEHDQPIREAQRFIGVTSNFGAGGVAYRREDFLATDGYLPLAIAYGMEEVDLCIRLYDLGKRIYFSPWLRVFHDTTLSRHRTAPITAASTSNLALLVFLRYPKQFWIYGALQVLNRVVWLIRARRFAGIGRGICQIPAHLWVHRHLREPVSSATLKGFLRLRKETNTLRPIFSSP